MRKYITKSRRIELSNAGLQMTFNLQDKPGQFVPDNTTKRNERRLMLRTDKLSMRRIGTHKNDNETMFPIVVLNDLISSRRGKKDNDNEHSIFTRFDIMSHDLDPVNPRHKTGVKCRAYTRDYPEGILCTCHQVSNESSSDDPIIFTAYITLDPRT